jgi:RNA polymerase sigma-70 factor (ECF subfamily)
VNPSQSDPPASVYPGEMAGIKCRDIDDSRWFAEDVYPHDSSLRYYLRAAFPSVHDVDDVVQESYLRVWQVRAAQPIRSVKAFLFTVARRLAIDVLRHDRRSPVDLAGDLAGLNVFSHEQVVTEIVSKNEKVQLLIDAIDSLPARCREIVIQRKLKLASQKEVAAMFGISEKGVENQLARGLTRCRKYLRRRGVQNLYGHES